MTAIASLAANVVAATLIVPIAAIVVPRTQPASAVTATATALWIGLSALLVGTTGADVDTVVIATAVLVTAVTTMAGVSLALRSVCSNPLDAIAGSLIAAAILTFGVFAIGRFAGELPPALLNIALATNPLVATAAAANIDLFRTDFLYRTSPLPHLLFTYPSWRVSIAFFATLAGITIFCAWWRTPVTSSSPVAGEDRP